MCVVSAYCPDQPPKLAHSAECDHIMTNERRVFPGIDQSEAQTVCDECPAVPGPDLCGSHCTMGRFGG